MVIIVATNLINTIKLNDNVYDYSFHALRGHEELPLAQFRGKVLMIVNTASKCGFTPQYERLEKLYEKYRERGLVILGVPSNDFGKQEPGTEEEISNFCQINYGVSFPMTTKEVVSGKNAHPFYLWARQKLGFGTAPKWNFHKYLISRKGELIDYFYSTTSPEAGRVIKAIEKALNEKA
ncbi:glutathione peroxidase [Legionella maioricensis]|uniref:glutathione peroxidase n=1 Tax=Legionella maioricensis TaxID=2896528 RepID=UPI0032B30BC2